MVNEPKFRISELDSRYIHVYPKATPLLGLQNK